MKKIIILSDTHGRMENIKTLDHIIRQCDYVFFLGDCISDIIKYQKEANLPASINFVCVKGNCDFFSRCPDEEIVVVEDVKFLLTHGHTYGVKGHPEALFAPARSNNCAVAFYGHTHIADITEGFGIKLVNPGSLGQPRKGSPTYGYAVVDKGEVSVQILDLTK